MPSPSTPPSSAAETARRRVSFAGLVLAVAVVAAYVTSFRGVMVFDDRHAIVENPTIRDLGHLGEVLLPPGVEGGTIGGRPAVNLTLALNYAAGGLNPWGYHAVNLAIHVLAALTLFGLARRTLQRVPSLADSALPLAFVLAALWALHPLQTESVTYLVQRAEALMGLCYLLTLYCFIRACGSVVGGALRPDSAVPNQSGPKAPPTSSRSVSWLALSFLCCLLGMASKEVMVSAPLLVLLYDRTFVAGSWREAWRRRGGFHAALFGTWLLLAVLVAGTAGRGGTAGFATAITPWAYVLTQCAAIIRYLWLAVWPYPLVFDYGTPLYPFSTVLPQAALLLGLLGATAWALVRRPALGFLGAWFFLILAPSSSVVPVATQTMAEHRMYLPLAAVLALLVCGVHALAGRRAGFGWLALAAVAGILTGLRNVDYRSELVLWGDTVAHCPENPRAHTNLGIALVEADRLPEAVAQFEESLRLQPDNAATHLNLCDALIRLGQAAAAVPHGEAAVRLEPGSANAQINLALALTRSGRAADAIAAYEAALRIEPGAADATGPLAATLYDLGNQAAARGDFAGAVARYRRALAVAPDHVPARNNLANALLVSGQVDEAITQYEEVLRRKPGDPRVLENLARAREMQGGIRR